MFEIEFSCRNCGEEWSKQFEPETRVKKLKGSPNYSVAYGRVDWKDYIDDESKIMCPSCKLHRYVKISERLGSIED